jgi:hypothetical protein
MKSNMGIKLYLPKHKMSILLHHLKNWFGKERGTITITHETENYDAGAILYSGKYNIIQGNQKVSVHLMITVQKTCNKYFKQFQSLTMIT